LSERIVTFAGITIDSIPHPSNECSPRKIRESGKWIDDKRQQQEKANDFARRVVIGEWESKITSFTGDLRKARSEMSLMESGIVT
jgi:hypothetical protein